MNYLQTIGLKEQFLLTTTLEQMQEKEKQDYLAYLDTCIRWEWLMATGQIDI